MYHNLKKSCHHCVTLLLFDDVIFFVKQDGFRHCRQRAPDTCVEQGLAWKLCACVFQLYVKAERSLDV